MPKFTEVEFERISPFMVTVIEAKDVLDLEAKVEEYIQSGRLEEGAEELYEAEEKFVIKNYKTEKPEAAKPDVEEASERVADPANRLKDAVGDLLPRAIEIVYNVYRENPHNGLRAWDTVYDMLRCHLYPNMTTSELESCPYQRRMMLDLYGEALQGAKAKLKGNEAIADVAENFAQWAAASE